MIFRYICKKNKQKQQQKQQQQKQQQQKQQQQKKDNVSISKYNEIAKKIFVDEKVRLTSVFHKINISSFNVLNLDNTKYDIPKLETEYKGDTDISNCASSGVPARNKTKEEERLKKKYKDLISLCGTKNTSNQTGGQYPTKQKKQQQQKKQKKDKQNKGKTLNIFNMIFSDDKKVEKDYMVNGTYKGIDSFLLPYLVDRDGDDVISYLDGILTPPKIKEIINDTLNLYAVILYVQMKLFIDIYEKMSSTTLVRNILQEDPKLDLYTLVMKNNKNNKNNRGNSNKNSNNLLEMNTKIGEEEAQHNILKLEKLKLKIAKDELDALKVKYIHNNTINNKTRTMAIKEINKEITGIINKLRNLIE